MIEKSMYKCQLFKEMDSDAMEYWLDFKKSKFLHNIDTFYYSVKFKNDFRFETKDEKVLKLRNFFKLKYDALQKMDDTDDFYIPQLGKSLVLKPVTFSRFYNVCLSYPEYFDIFLAPVVPKGSDGGESLTCECIVQIRSYMLWQYGARDCFENSYRYVKKLAEFFSLDIDFVQENRIDYCWHTNYLSNPEAFFAPDNFYKMRVDRFKNATYVTNKVGAEDYEIDYVALGKRSDKVFIRIYQKTREVIEQNYKPWFLQVWQMNGLINRYDQYVYERAYAKRSWHYRFYARLEFYLEHGTDELQLQRCRDILSGDVTIEENDLIKLANELTPRLNYVINVEFQTMRRHSKSYALVPFKDHRDKGEAERIYHYLDNRKIITDYLTDKVFRLVEYNPDMKKSEREMCAFWQALRRTKCLDMKMTSDEARLIRNYNRRLDEEAQKKKFLNAAASLGLYRRGENNDSPILDIMEGILTLNDNDIHAAMRYKTKKFRQLNKEELAETYVSSDIHLFSFLDESTGVVYTYDTLMNRGMQEESYHDDSPGI